MAKIKKLGSARERLLASAYELFQAKGIKGVGIDAIIAHAGVARMTFYRCFRSKHDLVLAFLDNREKRWSVGWLEDGVVRRTKDPRQRLLAIFDLYDEWFRQPDYEACSFMKVLFEDGPGGAFGKAAARQLMNLRRFVERLAGQADVGDVEPFARAWQILMHGAVITAFAGDKGAARAARKAGEILLAAAKPATARPNSKPS
jgi:AcrR family transcriptional regulator